MGEEQSVAMEQITLLSQSLVKNSVMMVGEDVVVISGREGNPCDSLFDLRLAHGYSDVYLFRCTKFFFVLWLRLEFSYIFNV